MESYKEKIIDVSTEEEIWRDYTDAEIKEVEAAQAQAIELAAKTSAHAAAKASLLEKLGLSEAEAKLFLS